MFFVCKGLGPQKRTPEIESSRLSLELLVHVGVRDRAADGLDHDTGDKVRVDVGGWSSVLEVTVALNLNGSWDSDGGASISNAGGEGLHGGSLVSTGQSLFVVLTVQLDVFLVSLGELFNGLLDLLHTTWVSHGKGGDVGMTTSTIPVTLQWLWMEGDLDTELFGDSFQQVSGHPQLVSHLDALARTDLELPLGRHDLGVDTGDGDARVEAGLVVGLDDVSGVDLGGTDTTVVWALWSWEAALRPAVDVAVDWVQEGVLLLQTEPDFLLGVCSHQLLALVSVVELVWSAVVVPAVGQDNDVVASSERIWVESDWLQVDVRVVAWRLAGGRAVEVPLWKLRDRSHLLGKGSALRSEVAAGVDPDVLGDDLALLRQVEVLLQSLGFFQ